MKIYKITAYVLLSLGLHASFCTINAMESQELDLRKATAKDKNALRAIFNDAGDYYWENPPKSTGERNSYIEASVSELYKRTNKYVVVIKDTDEVIGIVGLNKSPDQQGHDDTITRGLRISVSGHNLIAKSHRRKGYATAITRLSINKTFADYPHLGGITSHINVKNEASIGVMEKLRFAHVGIMSDGNGTIDNVYKIRNPNLMPDLPPENQKPGLITAKHVTLATVGILSIIATIALYRYWTKNNKKDIAIEVQQETSITDPTTAP